MKYRIVGNTLCFAVKAFYILINGSYWAFRRKEVMSSRKKLSWANINILRFAIFDFRCLSETSSVLVCSQSIVIPLILFEGGLLCIEN